MEIPFEFYDVLEGPIEGLEKRFLEHIGDRVCNDPELELSRWSDYCIVGWRPATEKEMARSAKAASAARIREAQKKLKKETVERKEYERLKKKYA